MLLPAWHSDSNAHLRGQETNPEKGSGGAGFQSLLFWYFRAPNPANSTSIEQTTSNFDFSAIKQHWIVQSYRKLRSSHSWPSTRPFIHSAFGKWPQLTAGVQGQLKKHFDLNIKIQQSQCPYLIYILPGCFSGVDGTPSWAGAQSTSGRCCHTAGNGTCQEKFCDLSSSCTQWCLREPWAVNTALNTGAAPGVKSHKAETAPKFISGPLSMGHPREELLLTREAAEQPSRPSWK